MRRLALLLALATGGAACNGSIIGGASSSNSGGGQSQTGNGSQSGNGSQPGTGSGSGTPQTGGGSGSDPMAPPSAQVACTDTGQDTIGRRTLRRLTNAELEATIRGAFNVDVKQWAGLQVPPDPGSVDGFTNNIDDLMVSPDYARGALDGGRQVAALVSADPMLGTLLPCAATGDKACATTFVTTFGTKLFRRPLSDAEQARYLALYDKVVAKQGDFKSFVYWATTTMLQSPNVIYRTELGESDGAGHYKLTPYEVASELAYTFTGGPPPDDLLAKAQSGALSTPDQLEAAARALVYDGTSIRPAFRNLIMRFADQWMGLSGLSNVKKDAILFPDFTSDVQDALATETQRFISGVMLDAKGTVSDLLTAPYTFVDSRLAKFYGFGDQAAADFTQVNRPADWGVGLLAQGSLLAVKAHSLDTSPTKRGHLIRSGIMCGVVPPPPPVVGDLPPPTDAQTTRQRYEELHAVNPSCKACHQMMDPIGFGFEHLDASGRYRAKEGAFDIDDSGTILASSKGDITFKGPTELAQALTTLPEVSNCWASHIAAFAFGVSHENAACLVASATKDLRGGINLLDFYMQMARSDHFRLRQP